MFLPRKVLEDNNLHHGSKLLMYEILSLSELKLGCIAENFYFMKLLNVKSERTIQNWLKQLKDNGYINVKMKTRPNRRGQTRLCHPTTNILQSMNKVEQAIDEQMESDKDTKKKDWFDEYMKKRLNQ